MSSANPDDTTPIEGPEQLVEYLAAGCKPPERWAVGTEHEKLGWWPDRAAPPTFGGPRGISALLERLRDEAGWEAIYEGDFIVALRRDGTTITLEPGGQLELSGAPFRDVTDTEAELTKHLAEVRLHSEPLGLQWSALGYAPSGTPETRPWVPKCRYAIMRRYLPTRGALALHMMAMTCTVQANFDFADEADAMRKLRVSFALQPLVMAAFANSTVRDGRLIEERTFRSQIWRFTDPDRCLLPRPLLEPGAGFADYVEWALDVPMFFLFRNDDCVDCAGLPFRRFLSEGFAGHTACMGDFVNHLSTLFPDVRIKQYLEVRGADVAGPAYIVALPALFKGLLYDAEALSGAEALFDGVSPEAIAALRLAVEREGLSAVVHGLSARALWAETLRLGRRGLERLEPGAARFLDVLDADLEIGTSPADRVRAAWTGDVGALMERTRVA